MDILLLDCVPL